MNPMRQAQIQGGALVVAMVTIAVLSMIAGYFIASVTARSRTAIRAASWAEAGLAAESAADLAVAEIRGILPTTWNDLTSGWGKRLGSAVGMFSLTVNEQGAAVMLKPTPLQHGGEGNTTLSSTVVIDALNKDHFNDRQWFRLRVTGTATVPGRQLANASKLDARLRRMKLVRDNGKEVTTPFISRTFELVVRPVLPFESALISEGLIDVPSTEALVDSYNSLDPLRRTYDSARARSNATVYTNGPNFTFGGTIRGDVGTNGGALVTSEKISGTVSNQFYQRLAPVPAPNWSSYTEVPPTPGAITVRGGLLQAARYKLRDVSSKIKIERGTLGLGTRVELWITGDLNGKIEMEDGMNVVIYAEGNIRTKTDDIDNPWERAQDLQIYGVSPPPGETREIALQLGRDLYAAVYAPGHDLRLTQSGDLMGAYAVKSVSATGTVRFHYDEALKLRIGQVLDYRVASWVEDLR